MRWFNRIVIVILFSSAAYSQTGILRGVVTDESGAIVAGAAVTLTTAAGVAATAVAANDGSNSAALPPGEYTAETAAPDPKSGSIKIVIRPGVQGLNLQLKVAPVAQQVTVEERPIKVRPEAANNASATVLAGNDLEALSDNPGFGMLTARCLLPVEGLQNLDPVTRNER